jgi:hypothetical protein
MARTIRDAKLESRAARARLALGKKPHWKTLEPGKLHLGYPRRKKADEPGTWLVRRYIGAERYRVAPLGLADDFHDEAISFADAQRLAHERRVDVDGRKGKSATVADAIKDYVEWMKVHRVTGTGVEQRAALHILPQLGKFKLTELTTPQLNRWRDALAQSPALMRSQPGGKRNARPLPTTEDGRRAHRVAANKIVTILKAALNHAFRNDLISDDKAWRRLKPFAKVDAARPRS